jgi:hypothetical protein
LFLTTLTGRWGCHLCSCAASAEFVSMAW